MKRDCWNKNTNRIKTALLTITDLTNNLEPARNRKKNLKLNIGVME